MKKVLKIFLGLAILATVALSCVACSVGTWVDQMVCDHEYDGGVITKESTCSEFGELTKTCKLCEKTEVEKVDKLDHVIIMIEPVDSTCIKTGLTSGTKCSVCDTVIVKPQEVPAKGHKVVKDNAIAATCLTSGLSEGTHCERCNEILDKQTVVPAHGHKLVSYEEVDATCTEDGHSAYSECSVCKVKYGYEEYIAGHKTNDIGICSKCGFIPESAITLENLNNEEYFTKTELKAGDVIELDKVVIYSVATNIHFETMDNFTFAVSSECLEEDVEMYPSGYGIVPSKAEFFYETFASSDAFFTDFLLHIPESTHLFYDEATPYEDMKDIDYQFTDMTVTVPYFDFLNPDVSAVYVYTPVV